LLDRLGITQVFSLPGNPQANGVIERLNRSLWLPLAKQLPLYSGKDMDKEAFKRRKDRADKTGAGLIGYADFVAGCAEAVAEYNAREHSSLRRGRERLSPNAAWARAVEEGWQPTTLDSDDLHDLLPSEVRVCRRCEVPLPWGIYFSRELEPYEGQRVHVGYEPSDNARAWISDQDGRLICVAELGANQRSYQPVTAIEKAREKRGTEKVKRLERRIERARAEETPLLEGRVLEGEASELPYLGISSEPSLTPVLTAIPSTALDPSAVSAPPESVRVAAELPKARQARSYIDELDNDASRYEVLKTLRVRMAAGDALTEREQQFFTAFGTSEYVRITEKLQADWDAQWAQPAVV
jgi:putative transposase